MVTIRTTCAFEAAHRQYGDRSKCGYLHGHNWKADIEINKIGLNEIGYVIDFKELKDWIKNAFDHRVILHEADPLGAVLEEAGQRISYLEANPTCEVLASVIRKQVMMMTGIRNHYDGIVKVTLWENGDSYACE